MNSIFLHSMIKCEEGGYIMKKKEIQGHIMALIPIIVWGVTFVSTKQLLRVYSPEELLVYRFFLATLVLLLIPPIKLSFSNLKEEVLFAMLGLFGITLYYWFENIALHYTYATNVGLITSTIPIWTALMAHFLLKDEKFSLDFIIGFILSISGIGLILLNGKMLKLNPLGDFLAILTTFCFAIYSVLLRKIKGNYSQLYITKKIFLYAYIFIIPLAIIFKIPFPKLSNLDNWIIYNFLFLALIASVLCFVLWNKSISLIGAVKPSNYIYYIPIITMISAYFILKEKITFIMILGGLLVFLGVYFNNAKLIEKFRRKKELILSDGVN